MKTFMTAIGTGLAITCFAATAAESADGLAGTIVFKTASEACAPSLMEAGQPVRVKFDLPGSGPAADEPEVRNLFRYNYRDGLQGASAGTVAASQAPRVLLSGEIQDYGAKGCTVSFETADSSND